MKIVFDRMEDLMTSSLAKQVVACNRRARKKGVVGTLSVLDWQRTLDHFESCCAYCGGPAFTIDHFVPLAFGGGTTVQLFSGLFSMTKVPNAISLSRVLVRISEASIAFF